MATSSTTKYCLDSNAVTDILRKRQDVLGQLELALQANSEIFIPSIVYYELVRGFKAAKSYHRLSEFYLFYESFSHLFLDRTNTATLEKAADIYAQLHKGRQIEDNDVYIAAISLANDCILVTDNIKHFGRIEGLKIINWRGEMMK